MIDESVGQPGAVPEAVGKSRQEKDGQGMVASYADSKTADIFDPNKVVERWEGESKGAPAPEGFDSAKFSSVEIAKRWEGEAKEKPAPKGAKVGEEFYQTIVGGADFKAEVIGGKGLEKPQGGHSSAQAGLNPTEPRIVQQAPAAPVKK